MFVRETMNKSFGVCVESRVIIQLKGGATPVSNTIISRTTSSSSSALYEKKPILALIGVTRDGTDTIPLSRQFGFRAGESFNAQKNNEEALKYAKKGETLWDIINDTETKEILYEEAVNMFPNINPLTREPDIKKDAFYTSYIPLVINSGAMIAQKDLTGAEYFNPDGTVSIAEVFSALQNVRDDIVRHGTSIDGVAKEGEYFTEGYNSIVDMYSSPLYSLYRRAELNRPVTRGELAYIVVVGWKPFRRNKSLIGGNDTHFNVGYRVNWETPARYVGKFKDARKLKVSKKTSTYDMENGTDIMEIDLKSWRGEQTMTDYMNKVQQGKATLPLPIFMSMIELDVLDLFYYENSELAPTKQVSRGELCYFLTKLAKTFSAEYKSSGDNTYI